MEYERYTNFKQQYQYCDTIYKHYTFYISEPSYFVCVIFVQWALFLMCEHTVLSGDQLLLSLVEIWLWLLRCWKCAFLPWGPSPKLLFPLGAQGGHPSSCHEQTIFFAYKGIHTKYLDSTALESGEQDLVCLVNITGSYVPYMNNSGPYPVRTIPTEFG